VDAHSTGNGWNVLVNAVNLDDSAFPWKREPTLRGGVVRGLSERSEFRSTASEQVVGEPRSEGCEGNSH